MKYWIILRQPLGIRESNIPFGYGSSWGRSAMTIMTESFTPSEIKSFRDATPGTSHHAHFNNAGTALPTQKVLDAVKGYLDEEAMVGGYKLEADQLSELDKFYSRAAELINGSPEEIAIVESATVAWRTVFNGMRFEAGDIILTSEIEYGSNVIAFLQAEEQFGVITMVVPNDEHGQISVEAFEGLIDEQTKLIAISHVPSNSGIVQPAEQIGEVAKKHGILFLLDACQSAGQIPLDVKQLNCDFLTATGRKYLRGPRGTGFLYIRKDLFDEIDPISVDMHGAQFEGPNQYRLREDAKRYETYEGSRALQMGLSEAIRYALELGMDRIWDRVQYLGDLFRDKLRAIPGITVQDEGQVRGGIVTFYHESVSSMDLSGVLEVANIRVSVTPKDGAIIYMHERNLPRLVRASIHYYNTEEEIDHFCEVLLNSQA